MKQTYEKAKAHVVLFDNSDVITTSGGDYGENAGEGSCDHGQTKAQGCAQNSKATGGCWPRIDKS